MALNNNDHLEGTTFYSRDMSGPDLFEQDEAPPSLSDLHDHEPQLEFDDTEIETHVELDSPILDIAVLSTTADDGSIEDDFEEQLGSAPLPCPRPALSVGCDEPAQRAWLASSGLVEVGGEDAHGRRVVVLAACRLPSSRLLDQRVLMKYLVETLDQYVEQDYSVVYLHHGLTHDNRPSIPWMWSAYRMFSRKYKKNLKMLYLVHPTLMLSYTYHILRTAFSTKFSKKVVYAAYLYDLRPNLDPDKLCIPEQVREYDKQLMARKNYVLSATDGNCSSSDTLPNKQFGVSLLYILENNNAVCDGIPPVMRQCIEYLSKPDLIDTEGLFRRSAKMVEVNQLKAMVDRGESVRFSEPHSAAVLLKTFLRELEEPLLPFYVYDEISHFHDWAGEEKSRRVKILILEQMPMENYKVLKYLVQFLGRVSERSCANRMTYSNLAVVFGPNLLRSADQQVSLQLIAPINNFVDYMLTHHHEIFII